MAPFTALVFILLGTALVTLDFRTRRGFWPAQIFAMASFFLGLIAIQGYLFDTEQLYRIGMYSSMSLPTALLFSALGIGVLLSRADQGWLSVLTDEHLGGSTTRWLLPFILVLQVTLAWLRWEGEQAGWYGTGFGLALFSSVSIAVLGFVVWRTGRWLNVTDIDRRRVEEVLRRSEARYSTLAEALPAIIFTALPNGRTDYVNRRWQEYVGSTLEQGLTLDWGPVVHPDDSERIENAWLEAVRFGEPYEAEFRLKRADGAYRWFRSRATPLRDEGGRIFKWLGIAADVDDEKKAAESIRESQKLEALGRLAGGVAHDFNNLLTAISGYNAFLMEQLKNTPALLEYAKEVNASADRAAELTRQLLAFSRRQVPQPKPLDVSQVVLNMRRLLGRLIGEDIELVTRFAAEPCVIRADPVQLDQVIMNLAINARDAMPNGGRLTFETARVGITDVEASRLQISRGEYVVLTVSDTGLGMDAVTKARLFEPFFTTKEQGKGTGLGLSIVYGVVKQNDGTITVDSEPGKGASFKVYFPIHSASIEDASVAASAAATTMAAGETILLVEDDASVRKLIAKMLQRQGYRLLEADTPSNAIGLLEREPGPIHLLLTDVLMPEMRGPALAGLLRQRRPELPVLFMSGYSDRSFLDPSALREAVYVQKPFTVEVLIDKIREALEKGPKGTIQ